MTNDWIGSGTTDCPRKTSHAVVTCLRIVTGYKNAQLYRLITRADRGGKLTRLAYHRSHPHRIYTAQDVKRLEKTDELHLRLSGHGNQGNSPRSTARQCFEWESEALATLGWLRSVRLLVFFFPIG